MAILVFPNREEADRGLESYIKQVDSARKQWEEARKEQRKVEGLEFPLLIELYATEEGFGANFSRFRGGVHEVRTINELIEGIRKAPQEGLVAALDMYVTALGAKLVPVLYTVLGQRHLVHSEGKNGDESFSFGEMSPEMKDFVARLPPESRAELEKHFAKNMVYERGLTEEERKEFEDLFYNP